MTPKQRKAIQESEKTALTLFASLSEDARSHIIFTGLESLENDITKGITIESDVVTLELLHYGKMIRAAADKSFGGRYK